jgi:hypothetical protein
MSDNSSKSNHHSHWLHDASSTRLRLVATIYHYPTTSPDKTAVRSRWLGLPSYVLARLMYRNLIPGPSNDNSISFKTKKSSRPQWYEMSDPEWKDAHQWTCNYLRNDFIKSIKLRKLSREKCTYTDAQMASTLLSVLIAGWLAGLAARTYYLTNCPICPERWMNISQYFRNDESLSEKMGSAKSPPGRTGIVLLDLPALTRLTVLPDLFDVTNLYHRKTSSYLIYA